MRHYWIFVLFASCSGPVVDYQAVPMSDSIGNDAGSEAIIAPYRDSLTVSMETVLVQNEKELTRNIPESDLGNLIADLLLERAVTELPDSILPDLCLINIGGLRVDLPVGPITVGKVFELMPFENEVDVVLISPEKMKEMFAYLKEKGGQPISGMRLRIKEKGFECMVNDEPFDEKRSYRVVTSDYLADGGDKMYFFQEPLHRTRIGISLRNVIMDHFRTVRLSGHELTSAKDGRLIIEQP